MKTLKIILIVGFVIIVYSVLKDTWNSNIEEDETLKSGIEKIDVDDGSINIVIYSYAKDCVLSNLSSPNTAKFPSSSDKINHVEKVNDEKYIVDSWVDSQNGFGAMVRTNFTTEIVGYDGRIICTNLKFL